jgi:hypothetical protein
VVGETMTRVDKTAQELKGAGYDVQTYQPRNFRTSNNNINRLDIEANRSWLRYWTNKGATVVDRGLDINRLTGRSRFYEMQSRSLYINWNYRNIFKIPD